jgi:two-component system, response regulator PdtaR
MNTKKANIFSPEPAQRFAPQPYNPHIVYSNAEATAEKPARAEPVCLLIVEDNYLVASAMEAVLTEAGFGIAGIAGSADEALELAKAKRPTLALMDIRLNGSRDGIDAAFELLAAYGIRCIFATAHHDAPTRARAQPAHPLAWVPKPYATASLVEAVERAVLELKSGKS